MARIKRAWQFISILIEWAGERCSPHWLFLVTKNDEANDWLKSHLTIERRWIRYLIHTAGLMLSLLAAALAVLIVTMPDWQETNDLWNIKKQYSITFLDKDGKVLGHRGGSMDTSYEFKDYPPHLVRAVLAVEDQRFYSHFGIDPIGIVSAFMHNVANPDVREKGGSTITQQVVKNIWLTPERSLARKIKEAWLAIWLEQHASKQEILKLYFERAYMGAGNYGLAAASQYYFDKPVTEVTIPEAAMLAGLFKAPVNYSPSSNLDNSLERMQLVLSIMRDHELIDDETLVWALGHDPRVRKQDPKPNEWALDYAYLEAMNIIRDRNLGQYRNFTVRTTIDNDLQAHADQVIKNAIAERGKDYDATQASLVSLGLDGSVRALVGGVDYPTNQFNRAISAKRQPGSSFKPFVYMAALLGGWTPDTRVNDSPVTINVFGKPWTPSNYDDKYFGDVTLREAMQRSLNTVAVKIMLKFGRKNIADVAHDAGIKSELKTVASLALGSNEVTLLELTDAYTTFAAGGQNQPSWSINTMESNGNLVYSHLAQTNHSMIFPRDATVDMVEMLYSVVEHGTATKAQLSVPVAGKTGTTSDYNDAWFIGFTGNLVTGVWFGNDNNTKMKKMTGGSLPAQTWHDYMVVAEGKEQPRGLPGIDIKPPTMIENLMPAEVKIKPAKKPKAVIIDEEHTAEGAAPAESQRELNFLEKLFGVGQ